MKEAGDLLLQLSRMPGLTHLSRTLKELSLDFGRKIIPLHDHGRPKASQDSLIHLSEHRLRISVGLDRATLVVPSGKRSRLVFAFAGLLISADLIANPSAPWRVFHT